MRVSLLEPRDSSIMSDAIGEGRGFTPQKMNRLAWSKPSAGGLAEDYAPWKFLVERIDRLGIPHVDLLGSNSELGALNSMPRMFS
jgi:hypothetical protein